MILRLTLLFLLTFALGAHAQERLLIFAAASLKNALDEVNAAYGAPVTASYAASSALARQIEGGAPVGVFISADLEWMDYLERKQLLERGSRRKLLGNRLVWIVPAGAPSAADPLSHLGKDGRLALADPHHVPAGKYAKAALERLGKWPAVARRLAAAENVRAALALVARAEPKVRIAGRIDAHLHPPIVYPAAAVRRAGAGAQRYLEFLVGSRATAIFEKHGFDVGR